jgi:hypothetical protein
VVLEDLREKIADVQNFAESLEHLDESAVLTLSQVGIHDVVVEKIGTGAWRNGEQLVSGAVNENGAESTDFGGDVNWHG